MADIHIRITDDERAVLVQEATRSGLTISEYARRKLFRDVQVKEIFPLQGHSAKDRNERICLRLSEAQAKALTDRCAEAGVSVSEYIRRALAQEPVIVIFEGKEILRQLSKLGNNINQLTMLAHQGKITAVDLDEVQRVQKKILQELIKILKRR